VNIDLSGPWRLLPSDDSTRRQAVEIGVDDRHWATAMVPGHWQSIEGLETSDGPVLYRRRVEIPPPPIGRRQWVIIDGVFSQADLWFDGAYLGDHEGTATIGAFEITELSRLGDEHLLAIEVSNPTVDDRPRRALVGSYQGVLETDPLWNPGGLAGSICVVDTGPVRIDRLRVLCRDADERRAHLLLWSRLDADTPVLIRLRTTVDGVAVAESEHHLAAGPNEVGWSLDVIEPELWWPRVLGEQRLVDIGVEIVIDGSISDTACRRTGLREIGWDRWICSVNGERLFLKGANLLPARLDIAAASPNEIIAGLEAAIEAGLDAVRVNGHLAPDALYERADTAGILLLQDFPMIGTQARSIRARAVAQAEAMVDRLGHHPSIALWWAHGDQPGQRTSVARQLLSQQRPSWNRAILDVWVKRAIDQIDSTRAVITRAGALPSLPTIDSGDTQLWFGPDELDELEDLARRLPRLVRFVSAFGTAVESAVGTTVDNTVGTAVDNTVDTAVDTAGRDELEQAMVVRRQIEILRRLKYRPTGGCFVYHLREPSGPRTPVGALYGLIDAGGRRRPAYAALVAACAPVIVVADRLPAEIRRSERIRTQVHLVSDRRDRIESATVRMSWSRIDTEPSTLQHWAFTGDIEPDSCALVAEIELEAPEHRGVHELHLEVIETTADGLDTPLSYNRYRSFVR